MISADFCECSSMWSSRPGAMAVALRSKRSTSTRRWAMPVQRNFWIIGLSVAGGTLLCCAIAVPVALFGMGQIGPNTELTALPTWLWYYRADPLLILWIKRGALAGAGLGRAACRVRVGQYV